MRSAIMLFIVLFVAGCGSSFQQVMQTPEVTVADKFDETGYFLKVSPKETATFTLRYQRDDWTNIYDPIEIRPDDPLELFIGGLPDTLWLEFDGRSVGFKPKK